MKETQKSANSTTAIDKTFEGFTDEERVAMKERVQELNAADARIVATQRLAAGPIEASGTSVARSSARGYPSRVRAV